MQRLFSWTFYLAILIFIVCCGKSTDPEPTSGTGTGSSGGCGTHSGHQLYKGSSGGCYYINSNGNKTYVDASECHC
jgi:hypothetical protein